MEARAGYSASGPPPPAEGCSGGGEPQEQREVADGLPNAACVAEAQRVLTPTTAEHSKEAKDEEAHVREGRRHRRVSFAKGPLDSAGERDGCAGCLPSARAFPQAPLTRPRVADGHPQHECAGATQVRSVQGPPRLPTWPELERDRKELGEAWVNSHLRRVVARRQQRRTKVARRAGTDAATEASAAGAEPEQDEDGTHQQPPSAFELAFALSTCDS